MPKSKAAQTIATKLKLEHVARKLFSARGFADVSAEEIVAGAGVTRGALYHHYGGKEGLFEAIVESVMQELHAKIARAAKGARDPLKALELGIGAFLDALSEPGARRTLLIDAPLVLGWAKWREIDARFGLGLLKGALAKAIEVELLHPNDIDVRAHLLMGALTEAALFIARSSEPSPARRAANAALISMVESWRATG